MKPTPKPIFSGLLCSLLILFSVAAPSSPAGSDAVILGEENNDGMLFRPFQADEGPDGNIYVFDAKDAFIKVFTPSGQYARRMGGRGQGPGEMIRLGSFGFTPDKRLFFTEMINGHRWITFMTLDGAFDKVLKISLTGSCGIQQAVVLPDGRILAEIHTWGIPRKDGKYFTFPYPRKLAIIDADGANSRTIIERDLPFSISKTSNGGDTRLPFFPEFLWTLKNNDTIIFSEGNSHSLQLLKLNGTASSKIETQLPEPPKVKKSDIESWKREVKETMTKRFGAAAYQQFASVVEDYNTSIFKTHPAYCGLSNTPAGNILVKGCRTSSGPERPYYLLNPEGKLISSIISSAGFIKFCKHFLLVIQPDDSDNDLVYLFPSTNKKETDILQSAARTN